MIRDYNFVITVDCRGVPSWPPDKNRSEEQYECEWLLITEGRRSFHRGLEVMRQTLAFASLLALLFKIAKNAAFYRK